MSTGYPFTGDERLAAPVARALHRVVDPELAIDIVALGLVYGVEAAEGEIDVRITMTSAACPVTEHIVAEADERSSDRATKPAETDHHDAVAAGRRGFSQR